MWWFLTTQSQAAGSVLPDRNTRNVLHVRLILRCSQQANKRIQTNENSRRYGDGDDRKSFARRIEQLPKSSRWIEDIICKCRVNEVSEVVSFVYFSMHFCSTEKTKCFVAKLISVRANKTLASTESSSSSSLVPPPHHLTSHHLLSNAICLALYISRLLLDAVKSVIVGKLVK